jgi:hypothetical protein
VRRNLAGLIAFFMFMGTFLVLPVYAAPGPEAAPVETFADEVVLGSVDAPALEADVQEGTTKPVAGVAATTPVLTVRETDVAEFSLVGVSWVHDPEVTDTLIQVRVKDVDGNWGDWTEVETDDAGRDPGDGSAARTRGGTEPLWTGPSVGVEVELVTRTGAQPTDVRLNLIDPGKSEADSALDTPHIQDTADAATAMPAVYSRAQWGADESLMTWDPHYASTLKAATLHHTAGNNSYTADQVPGILRAIYRYHAVTLGWGDIGYNALVDKYGRIWEGRAGGLASTVQGGHAGGFNAYTFGVSMIGDYDIAPTTQVMIDSVAEIIAWKLSLYAVNPSSTTTLVSGGTNKYPKGESVTLPTVFAHRDTKSTACPGKYGYAKMDEIRTKATSLAVHASFARSLYDHMMARGADEGGLRKWTNGLSEQGWSRRQVSAGFANSLEYRRLFITQAYQQVLGRAPDPQGLDSWMTALAKGSVSLDTLRPVLMSSEEFYLRGGSSDSAFVDNIYRAALGRGASSGEIAHWADVRQSKGAAAVIAGVWGSSEAAMRRVGQAYQYYLGRSAARSEQEYWLPVVARSGDEQLREEIVVSREYALKAESRFP